MHDSERTLLRLRAFLSCADAGSGGPGSSSSSSSRNCWFCAAASAPPLGGLRVPVDRPFSSHLQTGQHSLPVGRTAVPALNI